MNHSTGMDAQAVIFLMIFAASLGFAYGCWAMWWTDAKAEKRGDKKGFARGNEQGYDKGWCRGLQKGDSEGFSRGQLVGQTVGYELGRAAAKQQYEPWRAADGRFIARQS